MSAGILWPAASPVGSQTEMNTLDWVSRVRYRMVLTAYPAGVFLVVKSGAKSTPTATSVTTRTTAQASSKPSRLSHFRTLFPLTLM